MLFRSLAISRGFVLEVTAHHVVVGLDHSLTNSPQAAHLEPEELVFRVDKDELAAGMGRIRDNLIQLFVAGGDERRRRLVVDLEPPEFAPVAATERLVPSHLNEDQNAAVRKCLAARDYALILGMPGTGKTTTVAEILKALAKAGKSVLLTAYTHSAVDTILDKVRDSGLSILRLGNRDKVRLLFWTPPQQLTPSTLALRSCLRSTNSRSTRRTRRRRSLSSTASS